METQAYSGSFAVRREYRLGNMLQGFVLLGDPGAVGPSSSQFKVSQRLNQPELHCTSAP